MKKFIIRKNDSIEQKIKIIENINVIIAENSGVADMEIIVNTNRTLTQNSALHLYFNIVAEALQEKGLDFAKVISIPVDMQITADIVKNFMWRPIQKAMFGIESTIKLKKTEQIEMIYDVINKKLSESFEIYIPFPNREDFNKKRWGK